MKKDECDKALVKIPGNSHNIGWMRIPSPSEGRILTPIMSQNAWWFERMEINCAYDDGCYGFECVEFYLRLW